MLNLAFLEFDYRFAEDHREILEHAVIFTILDRDGDTAGFIWFYRLADNPDNWVVHLMAFPEFRKRFFCRTMVNSIFATLYCLGCHRIVAERESKEILLRMGAELINGEAILELPAKWRK